MTGGRYFRLAASPFLMHVCVLFHARDESNNTQISELLLPPLRLKGLFIFCCGCWTSLLLVQPPASSNQRITPKMEQPLPFLGHQLVLVVTQQIRDAFSVTKVVPPPAAGEAAIIETRRGGWAPLFRHLAYSPQSNAGFFSVYSFELS